MNENDLLKDVFADLINTNASGTPTTTSDPTLSTETQIADPSTGTPIVKDEVQLESQDPLNAGATTTDDLSWDSYVEGTEVTHVPNSTVADVNWSEIGKSIGLEKELKSSDEFKVYVEDLKKQAAEAKNAPKLEEFPEDLKAALEIAKNQGDYLAYLEIGQIDYTVFDPIELFEKEVEEFFVSPDGSFREKEYNDYIDSLDPADKKIRGSQLQKQLIAEQQNQKQAIKRKAEQDKTDNLRRLESSINKFEKLGEYVITPKIKQQVFQDLASGQALKKLGIGPNGAHNWDVLQTMYAKALYFDAIQKFNSDRVKNQTLRQEISKVGNHNLNTTPKLGNATETRKVDALDMYFDAKGIKR